ncbi:helix-turn-helix domain-containing protein [Paraburkholderia sp. BCC1884]|uniref:helix-turn-helix domain-containing protein n=1 Tax=Paraburkholderia sp. BCC1884 TaxID=2562668 RepID=UPI001182F368|nr:AraC family transcriptional regulator [Paraburkholderia sp. BCC1884]
MIASLHEHHDPIANIIQSRRYPAIDLEARWRCTNTPQAHTQSDKDVLVSRWTHREKVPVVVSNQGNDKSHCVGINMKCTSLTFTHAGRRLVDGSVAVGAVQVTGPAVSVSAAFEFPADVLHLFVPQPVLKERFEDLFHRQHTGDILLANPDLILDPAVEGLGRALAASQTNDAALGKVFIDSVSLAIVSRLTARHFTAIPKKTDGAAALPGWRLNRVLDYVENHLSENISLADMAQAVGLTRMHFSTQFRRATGCPPHEFLLRRRIDHAQHLLRTSKARVIEIALSCGFRSQAHFSTVFKRFVGQTPSTWRAMVAPVRGGRDAG